MTVQQAYELMRVYLTRPGARQAGALGNCMYETVIKEELHRCAVGCLLTPEDLSQSVLISHETAAELSAMKTHVGEMVELRDFQGSFGSALMAGYRPSIMEIEDQVEGETMFNFLEEAQGLHDSKANWETGKFDVQKLDMLAHRYRLKVVREEAGVQEEAQVQKPVAVATSVV